MDSKAASVLRRTFTPAFSQRTIIARTAAEICPFPVGYAAMRKLPPSSLSFSNKVTEWPNTAHAQAAYRPAGPPPTTATLFFTAAGCHSPSLPTQGFRAQVIGFPANIFGTHPSRQPIHGINSSSFPDLALLGSSGSAMLCLPNATRSARPCFTSSSAYCGSVNLPTVITGTETARLISLVRSPLKPPCVIPGAHINSSCR